MMDADAAPQHLLQLRPNAMRPFEFVYLRVELRPRRPRQQVESFQMLGDAPALIAVEAEDQCRRRAVFALALRHVDELIAEKLIRHPAKRQRDLALLAFDQLQL